MMSDNTQEHQNCKLLGAQAHVLNHTFHFINSMALNCAIQLDIPDIIHNHGKPMTLPELIDALPIHPTKTHCVHRLMRILVHSGFFARERISLQSDQEEEEGYVLTGASQLLIKDNPFSLAPYLQAMVHPILLEPWQHVSSWFKCDSSITPFHTAYGKPFWEYAAHDPKLNTLVNESMASDARIVTSVLLKDCKGVFDGLSSLVDVGGGTGTLAKAITREFPKLECIVLDLPHVVADLEGSENLTFVGGDMFEAIPPDAILLKCILHDWNNEECLQILKRCKEAIKGRQGGKVIIIDITLDHQIRDEKSFETQLFFDMTMMIMLTGQERNKKEWAQLFSEAGFSDYKITPGLGLRSLIEVYP